MPTYFMTGEYMVFDNNLDILFRTASRMHAKKINRVLDEVHMHAGQPEMLNILLKEDGVPQSVLARELNISPATAGTMVKRLEKNGYLERRRDSEDERISNVYLTEDGRSISTRLKELQSNMNDLVFNGFSNKEKEVMRNYLNRMIENLTD